jgi:hypothetical protein
MYNIIKLRVHYKLKPTMIQTPARQPPGRMHDDSHDEDVNPIEILEMTTIELFLYKRKAPLTEKGIYGQHTLMHRRRCPSDGCTLPKLTKSKKKSGT